MFKIRALGDAWHCTRTSGKHLNDRSSSQKGEVWIHKTSLAPPLFLEVSVSSTYNQRSCMWVLGPSISPLFLRFSIEFWNCSDSTVFFVFSLLYDTRSIFRKVKRLLIQEIHRKRKYKTNSSCLVQFWKGIRGHDRMVVEFTTTYAISAYHHQSCVFESHSWRGVLDTTLLVCDKVCHWLAAGRWFSPGSPVFSTNKTDHNDKAEILLKVALNTIT